MPESCLDQKNAVNNIIGSAKEKCRFSFSKITDHHRHRHQYPYWRDRRRCSMRFVIPRLIPLRTPAPSPPPHRRRPDPGLRAAHGSDRADGRCGEEGPIGRRVVRRPRQLRDRRVQRSWNAGARLASYHPPSGKLETGSVLQRFPLYSVDALEEVDVAPD